jgi:hypothetical protein
LSFYLSKIKEGDVLAVLEGIAGLHLFLQTRPEANVIYELRITSSIEVITELAGREDWPVAQEEAIFCLAIISYFGTAKDCELIIKLGGIHFLAKSAKSKREHLILEETLLTMTNLVCRV